MFNKLLHNRALMEAVQDPTKMAEYIEKNPKMK
jgi:hypothetical protein